MITPEVGSVHTLSSEEEIGLFLQSGPCYFAVQDSHGAVWLCTSSEDGDIWALRFASEDDVSPEPVTVLINDVPAPWVAVVIS